MRVLIHPGLHKTGTSTLQRCAQANAAALAPHLRMFLPHDLEDLNHVARRYALGETPKRKAALRRAARALADRIDGRDARPVLISSEHLGGVLPGKKAVTTYDALPVVVGMLARVLTRHVADLNLTVWLTTRAPEPWLRSVYWQVLRNTRLTEDFEMFAARLQDAACHEAVLAALAQALGPRADLRHAALEDLAIHPLGPLGAVLDILDVPTRGIAPIDAQNVQPAGGVDALLALNRSALDNDALSAAKTALLRQHRAARNK